MAAEGYTIVRFVGADKTACYFEDLDKDLEEDSFRFKSVSPMWIKSKNNEILILGESKEFQAKNLATNEQEKHPEHKFCVQVYRNSDKVGPRGAILYVFHEGKKLTVCCNNELQVHPEEMDVPQDIAGKAHKALFLRTEISQSCYLLESSVHPSMFLAFEPDRNNHTLSKLILRHKERDEVDESCHLTMI